MSTPPPQPSRAARFFPLFAVVGSLLACAVLLEVGLRLFWGGYYVRGPRNYIEAHPTRGWASRPNARVVYGKPEFSNVFQHNSLGFRGPDVEARKPSGRIRVLAIGDSMTYGVGVENDETYSARLEALDPRLQVLNAGVPGYSTAEEFLLLEEQGLDLAPDIVLVGFLWNDLLAVSGAYSELIVGPDGIRVEPPGPDSPRHNDLHERRVKHPWRSKSYAYRFISGRLKIVRYRVREAFDLDAEEILEMSPQQLVPAPEVAQGERAGELQ